MRQAKTYYSVTIAGLKRRLPLFQVAPGVKIALFNILGDTQVVTRAAEKLAEKIPASTQVLVTPEVKSIPLAYELSKRLNIPYIVTRKIKKPYMGKTLKAKVVSITTGKPQILHIDQKDIDKLKNKNVALVDDVISTGSTLNALRLLMKQAQAKIVAEVAVFTEGDKQRWKQVISLGHLPIFKTKSR